MTLVGLLLFDSFANRSIVLALFNTWGFDMDDVKAVVPEVQTLAKCSAFEGEIKSGVRVRGALPTFPRQVFPEFVVSVAYLRVEPAP